MSGTSQQTQQTNQTQQTSPWAATQPDIQGVLGALQPSIGTAGGTPQTQGAYDSLYANANAGNPYASGVGTATSGQLGGAQNYGQATGDLSGAYNNLQTQLSPFTQGNPFDPSTNPALASQLATVNSDVSGQVNPMFAAAGRFGSPDNYQALARGITQGSAPILQNAATNRLNAAGQQFAGGATTASGLLGADTANTNIQNSGINNTPAALQAPNYGALQTLGIAGQQQAQPVQNLSQIMGILGPLAGMFGTTTGQGQSTGTATKSPFEQATGWINSFANLGKAFAG